MKNIIEKIKKGEIKMKPKIYFVLRTILIVLGTVVGFLFILYLMSFILFTVRPIPGLFPRLIALPWLLVFVSVILLILITWSAYAILMKVYNTKQLTNESDAIVIGECVKKQTKWVGKHFETTITIKAKEYLKGDMGKEIKITQPGGEVTKPIPLVQAVPGMPYFKDGENVLLFIKKVDKKRIDKMNNPDGPERNPNSLVATSPYVFDVFLKNFYGSVDYKILAAGIIGYRRAREGVLTSYPHVQTTLMQLVKMGIKLAVVSDAPGKEAWLRLCALGFHHIFDVVVTFEDTGFRKPAPEPFLKALERLDIIADETIMVGDWAERDVIGAKKVGIRTVFAKYGDTFNTMHSGADFEIDDIVELVDIVKKKNINCPIFLRFYHY